MTKNTVSPTMHPGCTSTQMATLLAWEGTGVWVLDLTEENHETYESLPPTDDVSDECRFRR